MILYIQTEALYPSNHTIREEPSPAFALTSICTSPKFGTFGKFGTSHDNLECARDFWNTFGTRIPPIQRQCVNVHVRAAYVHARPIPEYKGDVGNLAQA